MCFLAVGRDFVMRIFLPVAIAIFNTIEFVDGVIVGDFALIKLAVVEFLRMMVRDSADCMEVGRLAGGPLVWLVSQRGSSKCDRWRMSSGWNRTWGRI